MSVIASRPSDTRSLPGSVNIPVAKIPNTPKPSEDIDAAEVAFAAIRKLNQSLSAGDFSAVSQLFSEDGSWRDHLALTWDFRTSRGREKIAEYLKSSAGSKDGIRIKSISVDASTPLRAPKVAPLDVIGSGFGIQFFITLETKVGTGVGLARLIQLGGDWKFFTLYTRLDQINGHEERRGARRENGVEHGGKPDRLNWADRRAQAMEYTSGEPAVLIVGAGHSGLALAARLKVTGVDALVVDTNGRVGDNWRKRYKQLVLHDPVWFNHMPHMEFPPTWPVFTPKDKMADFLESYVTLLDLNVWTSTKLVESKYDEAKKTWTVTLERKKADGSTEIRTLQPRHIVQATGHSGKKNQPTLKGAESFKGERLCHSSEFPGARADGKGRKAVVVGCCNSAHDIAQDFYEQGYDVTMVQRSSTFVVSSKGITNIALAVLYEEGSPPVDDSDMFLHGGSMTLFKALQVQIADLQAKHDAPLLEGLARAGFKTDVGPDGAGLFLKYLQRGGGYYIDVGASELIAAGKIKIKQGQEIDEVLPSGLRFADGSELEADEIVLATGYQNMRTQTREMFGDAVADRVSDVWGLDEEAEFKTMWKRSGHPGFWFHGGNLALVRYFSKLLALQITGQEAGLYQDGEL